MLYLGFTLQRDWNVNCHGDYGTLREFTFYFTYFLLNVDKGLFLFKRFILVLKLRFTRDLAF